MKNLVRVPDFEKQISESSRYKLAVVGAGRGVGTSYVSSYVLKNGLLNESTPDGMRTLVELGTPHFYVSLGMDKRFAGREFFDYHSPGKFLLNSEMGYNWYLKLPHQTFFDEAACLRAVYGAQGSFIVYDCSGIQDEGILQNILPEMDLVYLVIDPLPSELLASANTIEWMEHSYPDIRLVVNKFNKGIHKGELKRFLGRSNYEILPAVSYEEIYRAEYNCVLP